MPIHFKEQRIPHFPWCKIFLWTLLSFSTKLHTTTLEQWHPSDDSLRDTVFSQTLQTHSTFGKVNFFRWLGYICCLTTVPRNVLKCSNWNVIEETVHKSDCFNLLMKLFNQDVSTSLDQQIIKLILSEEQKQTNLQQFLNVPVKTFCVKFCSHS